MQLSSIPKKIAAIFGASAPSTAINTVPLTQAGTTQPGQASFDVGFPAITMQPAASGGINPYGQDFNGMLNAITAVQQWQSAGGGFPYDAAFSAQIGGYPKGAILQKADFSGSWVSTVDNNTTDPDTGGAGWNTYNLVSGVVGQSRNLVMTVAPAAASGVLTADEIIVESALSGLRYCLGSFNQTINLATTGAGGMDTGSAPTSGFVAIYAIYDPTTGSAALLATNATGVVAPNVYGGSNMPSGYTASALVAVWPTNSSGQFNVGSLNDRTLNFVLTTALSTSVIGGTTPFNISGVAPLNAKSVGGMLLTSNTASSAMGITVFGSSAHIGNASASANVSAAENKAFPFSGLPVVAPPNLYYSSNNTAGTPTFQCAISSFTF